MNGYEYYPNSPTKNSQTFKFRINEEEMFPDLWGEDSPVTNTSPDFFKPFPESFYAPNETTYYKGNYKKSLDKLKMRLPNRYYKKLRRALHLMDHYSYGLFPAFYLYAHELINEEWLALFDFHKPFHRDHMVHMTQTAIIVKTLLQKLKLRRNSSSLTERYCKHFEISIDDNEDISLLDLCAFQLMKEDKDTCHDAEYLYKFAEFIRLKIPICAAGSTQSRNQAVTFWRKTIYNSAITAALYHDIGYPHQFLTIIQKALDTDKKNNLFVGYNADNISANFSQRMFMRTLHGGKEFDKYQIPHVHAASYNELLTEALTKTHGFPSALLYIHLNNLITNNTLFPTDGSVPQGHNPSGIFTMEIAAMAMMKHDLQGLYAKNNVDRKHMRVSFTADPVSFLVTLADQIQSYDRLNMSSLTPSSGGDNQLSLGLQERIKSTSVIYESSRNELSIQYEFNSNNSIDKYMQIKFNEKTQQEFFDESQGYLDYSCGGNGLFSKITVGLA